MADIQPTPGVSLNDPVSLALGYQAGSRPAATTTTTTPYSPGVPGPSPTTTTSDPFRSSVNTLNNNIATANNTPITTTYNGVTYSDPNAFYDAARKDLQDRRDKEVANLNKEFDTAQTDQQTAQTSETGTTSMGLARLGGFDSASGNAVLTSLAKTHMDEQNALISKRATAIQQAQNAYADKDFALAESQLKDAKDTEQKIYQRQQDFNDYALRLHESNRADLTQQFNQTQALKQDQKDAADFALKHNIQKPFYIIGGTARDANTGEALSYEDYLNHGGDPNFGNAEVIAPNSEADRDFVLGLRDKYVDAGILVTDTAEQATAKLNNSRIYREQVRPPQGNADVARETAKGTFLANALSTLRQSKGEDQFVNPNLYRDLRDQWASRFGSVQSFLKEFPIENYITPDNQTGDLTPDSGAIL